MREWMTQCRTRGNIEKYKKKKEIEAHILNKNKRSDKRNTVTDTEAMFAQDEMRKFY